MKKWYIIGVENMYFTTLENACIWCRAYLFERHVMERKQIVSVRSGRCYSYEHDGNGKCQLYKIK